MKSFTLLTLLAAAFILTASPVLAATKTYQVTGPVLEIGADTITVQKGSDKWEIAKGAAALPADLKVGSKVTIQYTMTATTVTVKDAAKKK
jgi:hypothetical protein